MTEPSVLAVDLGGLHASCALVSGKHALACDTIPLDGQAGLAAALPPLAETLRGLLERTPGGPGNCRGIGFSFCGLVDSERSRILSTNGKYDDGPSIDLVAWARTQLGLPLQLENDARTALPPSFSSGEPYRRPRGSPWKKSNDGGRTGRSDAHNPFGVFGPSGAN